MHAAREGWGRSVSGIERTAGQRDTGKLTAQNQVSSADEKAFENQAAVGIAGERPCIRIRKRRRKADHGTALILSYHRDLLNGGKAWRGVVGQRIVQAHRTGRTNHTTCREIASASTNVDDWNRGRVRLLTDDAPVIRSE